MGDDYGSFDGADEVWRDVKICGRADVSYFTAFYHGDSALSDSSTAFSWGWAVLRRDCLVLRQVCKDL